jgi:hypothetical protein
LRVFKHSGRQVHSSLWQFWENNRLFLINKVLLKHNYAYLKTMLFKHGQVWYKNIATNEWMGGIDLLT